MEHARAEKNTDETEKVESSSVIVGLLSTTNLDVTDFDLATSTEIVIAKTTAVQLVKLTIWPLGASNWIKFTAVPATVTAVKAHCLNLANTKSATWDTVQWTNADLVTQLDISVGCISVVIHVQCNGNCPDDTLLTFEDQNQDSASISILGWKADRIKPYFGATAVTTARTQLDDWDAFWNGITAVQAAPAPMVAVHPKVVNLGYVSCIALKAADLDDMTKVEIALPDDPVLLGLMNLEMFLDPSGSNVEYIRMYATGLNAQDDPILLDYVTSFSTIKDTTSAFDGTKFTLYFTATRFAAQQGLWKSGSAVLGLYIGQASKPLNWIRFFVTPWLASSASYKITRLLMFNDGLGDPHRGPTTERVKAFIDTETGRTDRFIEVTRALTTWTQDVFETGFTRIDDKVIGATRLSPRFRNEIRDMRTLTNTGASTFEGVDDIYPVTRDIEAGGNIECTPPSPPLWPLGRIVVGSLNPENSVLDTWLLPLGVDTPGAGGLIDKRFNGQMSRVLSPESLDFYLAQEIQKPIELYSNWLAVGHIDEMLTFIPFPDDHVRPFRVFMAWPDLFFTKLEAGDFGGDGVTVRIKDSSDVTIGDIKAGRTSLGDYTEWKNYNKQITVFQQHNMDILKNALATPALDNGYFVKLPIPYFPRGTGHFAESLFPDAVNMIVGTKRVLLPNPWFKASGVDCDNIGPGAGEKLDVINAFIKAALPGDFQVWQLDDGWAYYAKGDIHCLTNTFRDGNDAEVWWADRPGP